MDKSKLKQDLKFLKICRKFGLDWKLVEYYSKENEIYYYIPTIDYQNMVILDNKYNVVSIEKKDLSCNLYDIVDSRIELFKSPIVGSSFPIANYSIENILDLSDKIEISSLNHVSLNNKLVDNPILKGLLTYIKILGYEASDYYLNVYPLIVQGHNIPDVYDYIVNFNRKINFSNMNNVNDILKRLGIWYQKRDEYTNSLALIIYAFKDKDYYNYIEQASQSLLDKIKNEEKGNCLVKK